MKNRWHEPRDAKKLNQLIDSMKSDGWKGEALVYWGEQLYTGAHRSKAAEVVGIDYPIISVEAIFVEAGLDFEELHYIHGEPTADDSNMAGLLNELPGDIRDKYGIDIC
jgi:hypothetical protein